MGQAITNQIIDGIVILNWFYLGEREVYANKKYLNSINVFPVADGDTGSNLSSTLNAMMANSREDVTFSGMIQAMSESGLAHARGNSGILFASYVKGLALEGRIFDSVTIKDFSYIAHHAVEYLYQAIENPMEGTMISVIKDWAAFLFYNHERYDNFQEFLFDAYQVARASLQKTAYQLEVLKRNHVVDSGAEGFVKFLNGINRYYDGTVAEEFIIEAPLLVVDDEPDDKYTYCTEVYMQISTISAKADTGIQDEIMHKLDSLGDSLIVSTHGNKMRIHIHTDTPSLVINKLEIYGTFLEHKVDNMKLQKSVKQHRISNIGILTDSIADLPDELKLNYQIHTLPLGLILDDSIYLDKLTIGLKQLFLRIPKLDSYPTSSQPEPGRIGTFLENLLDIYDSLIFITVADKLSGTYQSIVKEVKKLGLKGKKISVIDSKLNSGAQGLLVKADADYLSQGLSHDEIISRLEKDIPNSKIYVCLETIEYAIRSGRVSPAFGKLGMKLGLRPIMTLDQSGRGATFGAAFSKKGITNKIYRLLKAIRKRKNIKSYCIVHAENPTLAMEYSNKLTNIIGKEPEFISEISSIIAVHSGPGSVAVCLITD
jgi:DegV family protein with EDD domain